MKKNFLKKVIIMALTAFAFGVEAFAQESAVTRVSTNDFDACKEHLKSHPTDTIRSVASIVAEKDMAFGDTIIAKGDSLLVIVSVYKTPEGRIARHKAYSRGGGTAVSKMTARPKVKVTSVVKDKPNNRVGAVTEKVKVTSVGGVTEKDTLWFKKTSSNEVSFDDKVAVNRGQKTAINPEHKDMEGNFRHRVYVSVLGGGTFLNNGDIHPMVSGRLGYETCHWLFELDGNFSQANYTPTAEVEGRYHTFAAYVTAGWKFWQSSLCRSYLAAGISGGFAYQKTDAQDAEFYSSNYGAAGKVFLRGLWGLNRNFGLVFEGGYQLLPWVEHFGGTQDWGHGGAFVQAGLNYKF